MVKRSMDPDYYQPDYMQAQREALYWIRYLWVNSPRAVFWAKMFVYRRPMAFQAWVRTTRAFIILWFKYPVPRSSLVLTGWAFHAAMPIPKEDLPSVMETLGVYYGPRMKAWREISFDGWNWSIEYVFDDVRESIL
jgi:hypothetical protein